MKAVNSFVFGDKLPANQGRILKWILHTPAEIQIPGETRRTWTGIAALSEKHHKTLFSRSGGFYVRIAPYSVSRREYGRVAGACGVSLGETRKGERLIYVFCRCGGDAGAGGQRRQRIYGPTEVSAAIMSRPVIRVCGKIALVVESCRKEVARAGSGWFVWDVPTWRRPKCRLGTELLGVRSEFARYEETLGFPGNDCWTVQSWRCL